MSDEDESMVSTESASFPRRKVDQDQSLAELDFKQEERLDLGLHTAIELEVPQTSGRSGFHRYLEIRQHTPGRQCTTKGRQFYNSTTSLY